jgi:hypothetical protein
MQALAQAIAADRMASSPYRRIVAVTWICRTMETATHQSAEAREGAISAPADFVPLHLETRTHVSTAVLCRHLNRKEQTARGWASAETYPPGLKPLRIMGRLAWPVAGIRAVLGVTA